MEPDKLSYALRGSEDDFRKCLMRAMGSRGTVETELSVHLSGNVTSARVVGGSIKDASVANCLIDKLKSVRFSPQRTPSLNRYTFVFRLTDPLSKKERDKRLYLIDVRTNEALKVMKGSSGDIDLNHVAGVAQARYPLYAHCYRDSIKRRGQSRGVLRILLDIDAEGRVRGVEDDGSVMPDPYAVDCMAEAFYLMSFDPPTGGPVRVRYTIELE